MSVMENVRLIHQREQKQYRMEVARQPFYLNLMNGTVWALLEERADLVLLVKVNTGVRCLVGREEWKASLDQGLCAPFRPRAEGVTG